MLPQEGKLLEAVLKAEEFSKLPPTGRGAGGSYPAAVCLLMQERPGKERGMDELGSGGEGKCVGMGSREESELETRSVSHAAMCFPVQAKAHSIGGSPLKALPPALSAIALCEEHSLHSLHAAAVLLLVSVELELDATRALALLQVILSRHDEEGGRMGRRWGGR